MSNWVEGLSIINGLKVERIAIRTPIWHGRRIGITEYKANRSDICEVKVNYRMAGSGKHLIEKHLFINSANVLQHPREPAKGNPDVILCIVPISAMVERLEHALI